MKKIIFLGFFILFAYTSVFAALNKTIRFGTEATYPPFEYIDASGQMQGFDIDIANALCALMKVQCTFTNQAFDSLIPSLQLGKFDALIAAIGITEERKKQVSFTNSYYEPSAAFVALIDKKYQLDQLDGKTIGVQTGTTFNKYLQDNYGSRVSIKPYASIQDALLDLVAGRIDLVLGDAPILRIWLSQNDNRLQFTLVGSPIFNQRYFGVGSGIAVRKSDTELLAAFNAALATIKQNGTYQTILARYFGEMHAN